LQSGCLEIESTRKNVIEKIREFPPKHAVGLIIIIFIFSLKTRVSNIFMEFPGMNFDERKCRLRL